MEWRTGTLLKLPLRGRADCPAIKGTYDHDGFAKPISQARVERLNETSNEIFCDTFKPDGFVTLSSERLEQLVNSNLVTPANTAKKDKIRTLGRISRRFTHL